MDTVRYNEHMHEIDMKYQLEAPMHAVMACHGSNVVARLIVMLLQMIMGNAFNVYTYFQPVTGATTYTCFQNFTNFVDSNLIPDHHSARYTANSVIPTHDINCLTRLRRAGVMCRGYFTYK